MSRAPSLLIALTLALGALRPAPADAVPNDESPSAMASAEAKPATPSVDCGARIEGAATVLRAGALVMLGELHGTQQIPAFVGDLTCAAAMGGLPVRVGVELPRSQDVPLATYIAGAGGEAERAALLAAEHWQRVDQDGRSSRAMLALIERVRVLRIAGLDVTLFAFDVEAPAQATWNERDRAMAERILERAKAEPEALVLTLSGNLHNRAVQGLPWDPNAVPMGVHVRRARPDALSLDARYQDGTAWTCQQSCGATRMAGRPEAAERRIDLRAEPDEYGLNGTFSVGPIEASPPAKSFE